jgi:2-polyprenyl-6-methoxyphenol hydroxylase-like FAD-dependent oxidoreductase
MASSLIGKQAIVVGAGMGGLAAAGAIAQHFEQVVVVERDGEADENENGRNARS